MNDLEDYPEPKDLDVEDYPEQKWAWGIQSMKNNEFDKMRDDKWG